MCIRDSPLPAEIRSFHSQRHGPRGLLGQRHHRYRPPHEAPGNARQRALIDRNPAKAAKQVAARCENDPDLCNSAPIRQNRPARKLSLRSRTTTHLPVRYRSLEPLACREPCSRGAPVCRALDEGDRAAIIMAFSKAFRLIGAGLRERFCPVFVFADEA